MRKRAQVIFIYFLKILFKRFRNPQRHTQSIVWNRPRSTIKAKHLASRGGGTQNRHPDMIWYGGNWHFRLFSGHGNGNALKKSWRWSSSLFLDGQLSDTFCICALCLRLNAVWGAICISRYISTIYQWEEECYAYIYMATASENPTENRRGTGCGVMHSAIYVSPAWLKWLPRYPPTVSLAWVPPSLSPSLSLLVEQSTCDNISKEATDRRRQQHQTEKPSSSVGNYFN